MCVYVLLLIRVRPGPDDRQPQRWCSKLPVQQRYTSLLLWANCSAAVRYSGAAAQACRPVAWGVETRRQHPALLCGALCSTPSALRHRPANSSMLFAEGVG